MIPNVILNKIFGNTWSRIRSIDIDDRNMHLACDICDVLEISNVTLAIRGVRGEHRVSRKNRNKELVKEWNPRRKVHLLTIEGVFQLIMHNKTDKCREIKDYLACNYLPSIKNLNLQ